jgi:hypothetical protein
MRIRLLATLLLATSIALPSVADAGEEAEASAKRFVGSSILVEHGGTIGHSADTSPDATRVFQQTVAFGLAWAVHEKLGFSLDLAMVRELTSVDTTYAKELLVDDLELAAALELPGAEGDDGEFAWGVGLGLAFPTSKASRAASLVLAVMPSLEASLTADLLDGLTLSYAITPTPRLHRYSTISTQVAIPCSPAVGCELGRHFDSGARNTKFELVQDIDLSMSAWEERISVSGAVQIGHGWLYALSESPSYAEEDITNPGNSGGSPVTMTTAFTFEVGVQPHPAIGVAIGIWTPGAMRPDGTWYNPLGNRHTQLYFDVVLTPVDGILHTRSQAAKAVAAE